MQFEKAGRGLLREAFYREGECFVSQKKGGNKKAFVLENAVNTKAIRRNKKECSVSSCVFSYCTQNDVMLAPFCPTTCILLSLCQVAPTPVIIKMHKFLHYVEVIPQIMNETTGQLQMLDTIPFSEN